MFCHPQHNISTRVITLIRSHYGPTKINTQCDDINESARQTAFTDTNVVHPMSGAVLMSPVKGIVRKTHISLLVCFVFGIFVFGVLRLKIHVVLYKVLSKNHINSLVSLNMLITVIQAHSFCDVLFQFRIPLLWHVFDLDNPFVTMK